MIPKIKIPEFYKGQTLGEIAFNAFIKQHKELGHDVGGLRWQGLDKHCNGLRLQWNLATKRFAALGLDDDCGEVGKTFFNEYWVLSDYIDHKREPVAEWEDTSKIADPWYEAGLSIINVMEAVK